MQYVHLALALHSAGKEVSAENIKKMLKAVGVEGDDGKIKALVASLEGVDIDEKIKSAPVGMVASAPSASSAPVASSGKKEEAKKEEEPAAGNDMGLDSLFG